MLMGKRMQMQMVVMMTMMMMMMMMTMMMADLLQGALLMWRCSCLTGC